jgi:hypothetical protein
LPNWFEKRKTNKQYQADLSADHDKRKQADEARWKKNNLGSVEQNILDAGRK